MGFSGFIFSIAVSVLAADLPSGIERLEPGKSTAADLIRVAGEPIRYMADGGGTVTAPLPAIYMAVYDGWGAVLIHGAISELNFQTPQYAFRGKLKVGSTVEETVAVLGTPAGTVRGEPRSAANQERILYLDVDGKPGYGYYSRPELGVRVSFRDGVVGELMVGAPKVVFDERRTPPLPRKVTSLPRFDPTNTDAFQLDLRGRDLTALDLRDRLGDLLYCTFDDLTVWPPAERMPAGFDRAAIAALGRDPGLGVRSLHQRGITGKDVAIAIIDNPLNAGHREYAGRIARNEAIRMAGSAEPHMHGAAVVSIAAGETVGVAPQAIVHYFTNWATGPRGLDFRGRAQAVRRILEINRELPAGKKIRVISMSLGWSPGVDGYEEMQAAAEAARDAGLLFVSSSMQQVHGFGFNGLGRSPEADPQDFESYLPGRWWASQFYSGKIPMGRLMVPMDSRTTASEANDKAYVFYRNAGWSWSIPYIAGLYALAVQVRPGVTPQEFWDAAMQTSRTIRHRNGGKEYDFGPIADPPALIRRLESAGR
jgi:hypothetical protein